MALSHIVATDYNTMITLVSDIKEEEKKLDGMLADYEMYITDADRDTYNTLLSGEYGYRIPEMAADTLQT